MTQPRKNQISVESTPYYHCVSRCVRRAFLCGHDRYSGKSFEHRRGWIEDKLIELSQVFKISIVSYAVMSNHYHVVVFIEKEAADEMNTADVITRWHKLFKGNSLSQAYANDEALNDFQMAALERIADKWRKRLFDLSWFMRCINESIARLANQEDDCTGRFWEGRFKTQALLDEKALMACMAYVDLNPIRAKMATTLFDSEHTSIKKRISEDRENIDSVLYPFKEKSKFDGSQCLPFSFAEYLQLMHWTGRLANCDSVNLSEEIVPSLLSEVNFDAEQWVYVSQNFESDFRTLIGSLLTLKKVFRNFGLKRIIGITACSRIFDT